MEGFRRMLKTFRIAFFMSLVILSNEYRGAAFDLTRGKIRDQFSNPQCGNGTFVSALCERYNAVCKTSRCKYCVCNENDNRTTYFRNNNSAHGQCTRDFVIAKDSGEYMQFMLYFDYLLFFIIICFSRIILAYYCKCCNLIGYSTRYLFIIR